MHIATSRGALLIVVAVIALVLAMTWTKQAAAGQDYRFAGEPVRAASSEGGYVATEELFHTRAIAIPTNRFLGKWQNLVVSIMGAASVLDVCGEVKTTCSQAAIHWASFLSAIRSLPKSEQIDLVNGYVNQHIEYTNDRLATGAKDDWASPFQAIGALGDCEDYAIAKYVSFILLGFSDEQLRLVIVKDLNIGEMHALTTVSTGETTYVLDNRFERVTPHHDVKVYQPIYSFNQKQSWLHVARSLGYRSARDEPAS